MTEKILRAINIHKHFGGVYALQGVDFALNKKEIVGLVGENGAGKSTLLNIFSGVIRNDIGEIEIFGKSFNHISTNIAIDSGIAIIPQKLQIVPNLSVAENIFLNNWSTNKIGFISWSKLNKQAKEMLNKLEIDIDPKIKVENLAYVDQQMVSITKAIFAENARIFNFLDEPTAPLVYKEIELLLEFLKFLKDKGTSIIYVSHYLSEIFQICDRVVVLRNGKVVGNKNTKSLNLGELTSLMVGEDLTDYFPHEKSRSGEVILNVKDLTIKPLLKDVNFYAKKGEILGLVGLKGSGRTELARAICGLDNYDKGEVIFQNKRLKFNNVNDYLKQGVGYLPEDRNKWGMIGNKSVKENITVTVLDTLKNLLGFLSIKKEAKLARNYINDFNIKASGINQKVSNLSGGNQQKVIISKFFATNVKLFFLDDPCFGIDVKTKKYIYKLIKDFVRGGKTVILISSELIELLELCDRLVVIYEGRVRGTYINKDIDEHKLRDLMEGVR